MTQTGSPASSPQLPALTPAPPEPSPPGQLSISISSQTWPLRSYLELEVTHQAPRQARYQARQALGEWGLLNLVEDAELVISELVTNAVQAVALLANQRQPTDSGIRLWLSTDKERLLIQVWDPSDKLPAQPAHVPADASSGRGLLLVESISQEVGAFKRGSTPGKVVWAILG